MRRLPAIFLIALFSFSLIAPALFASDPYANLPACCRRDGKHHCAMTAAMMAAMMADSSGPVLATGTCADYPLAKIGPAGPAIGFAQSAVAIFGLEAVQQSLDTQAQPFAHASYSRAGQKRGPPVTLA